MSENERDSGFDYLSQPITRRQVLRGALVAGAGVSLGSLLAACGGGTTTTTASASSSASPGFTTATPKKGGTLVYARRAATLTLDPLQNRNGNGDIFAAEIVYNALVRPDPKGSTALVAGLSDQWDALRRWPGLHLPHSGQRPLLQRRSRHRRRCQVLSGPLW